MADDDDDGLLDDQSKIYGQGGKPEAIRRIRPKKPLHTVVMVGDGITDFVGSGGIVERPHWSKKAMTGLSTIIKI
jgi:hypothetical protein